MDDAVAGCVARCQVACPGGLPGRQPGGAISKAVLRDKTRDAAGAGAGAGARAVVVVAVGVAVAAAKWRLSSGGDGSRQGTGASPCRQRGCQYAAPAPGRQPHLSASGRTTSISLSYCHRFMGQPSGCRAGSGAAAPCGQDNTLMLAGGRPNWEIQISRIAVVRGRDAVVGACASRQSTSAQSGHMHRCPRTSLPSLAARVLYAPSWLAGSSGSSSRNLHRKAGGEATGRGSAGGGGGRRVGRQTAGMLPGAPTQHPACNRGSAGSAAQRSQRNQLASSPPAGAPPRRPGL